MDKYDVFVNRWSYNSSSNNKYTGTIKELKAFDKLGDALRNKNPRTQNGLQKALDQYAKKVTTYYTGVAYEVFMNYGD